MNITYAHTNLIAEDWKGLSDFYREVFGCIPQPPERDLSGKWLDRVTGIEKAHISGIHLRLPGHGNNGPTLEIFQYDEMPQRPGIKPNTPGFSHIAFVVDDLKTVAALAFSKGGSAIGELVVQAVPGVGTLSIQYIADPEGNIVEIQRWD